MVPRSATPAAGWNRSYEQNVAFAAQYATDVGAHALLFNYRGVSASTGWPSRGNHLVEDGRAAIRYVMEEYGVDESQVLLHGHSMGGGVVAILGPEYPK